MPVVEKKFENENSSIMQTNNNTNQSYKKMFYFNNNATANNANTINNNFSVISPSLNLKKYHAGKKIHTIKSGEFVLHQLYNQKKI